MAIFDKEAATYDSWYQTLFGSFIDQVESKLAFDLFPVRPGSKILDVGCGTGNFSLKLAKKGCQVIGIDISRAMLDIAAQKAKEARLGIEFRLMDLYQLQFPAESFDGVFSMAAFEFVKEPEKAMEEFFRVTKKGGYILIGTIHKDSRWGELYQSQEFQKKTVFKYADFKTLPDLQKLKPEHLVNTGECLFVPPDAPAEKINMETENKLAKTERGGFICALWRK